MGNLKDEVRRIGAAYIMSRDPRARSAYDAMRKRGMPAKDAKVEIEFAFEQCFREALLHTVRHLDDSYRAVDRREEVWLSLAEGLSATQLFDLPKRVPLQ